MQRVADAPGDYRLLTCRWTTGSRHDGSARWFGGLAFGWTGGPLGPHFGTDDVEAAVGRAEFGGGTVSVEPVDIPGCGRAAALRDPDGATFGIYQPS